MNINNLALKNLYDHKKWTKNVRNLVISDNNISSISIILELCTNL
jgi:Leucine-rich repeat (LRR) protein